jgi:deoxycytidine triphosphate deaminase
MSDKEILKALEKHEISIEPFNAKDMLGPCSVNLHLLDEFRVFKMGRVVDPKKDFSNNQVTFRQDNPTMGRTCIDKHERKCALVRP